MARGRKTESADVKEANKVLLEKVKQGGYARPLFFVLPENSEHLRLLFLFLFSAE